MPTSGSGTTSSASDWAATRRRRRGRARSAEGGSGSTPRDLGGILRLLPHVLRRRLRRFGAPGRRIRAGVRAAAGPTSSTRSTCTPRGGGQGRHAHSWASSPAGAKTQRKVEVKIPAGRPRGVARARGGRRRRRRAARRATSTCGSGSRPTPSSSVAGRTCRRRSRVPLTTAVLGGEAVGADPRRAGRASRSRRERRRGGPSGCAATACPVSKAGSGATSWRPCAVDDPQGACRSARRELFEELKQLGR